MIGPADERRDDGFSLLEMMVSLAITSVVMVIFTAGFVHMMRLYSATSALADAEAQVGRAFRRLDTELRYAADVRTEVLSGAGATESMLYVSTAAGPRCYALSLVGDALERREWAPGAAVGDPQVLARGVSALADTPPFDVTVGDSDADGGALTLARPKEATIALAATGGGQAHSMRRELRARFTAPNTVHGPRGVSLDDCVP